MKERLAAYFKNPRKGKSRRISLILTIVALVEIFAIMVVSTSAWVESISSIKIFTDYDASSNPSGTKGTVETLMKQRANLLTTGTNSATDIDLRNYFRQSGGYHLAGASSVDGKTMFFPGVKDGGISHYRIGNVNDKNVNYISFTIKTTTAVNLAFSAIPTISFDGTPLDKDSENSKLVRFSVGDNAGNYRVYSLYKERFTESVPAAEDGTTQETTVYPFSDYLQGVDRVVTTTANGYLSFNMWIQDPKGENSSVYHNKAMTVSDLQLVTVVPITLVSTYTDNNGKFQLGSSTNNPGGTVAISKSDAAGDEVYSYRSVYYAGASQTIYLKAKASETNGYAFLGFKTSSPVGSTSTAVTSTSNPYAYTVSGEATVYALFSNVHTIYMKPEFNHSSSVRYAAYVFGVDSTGATTGNWYSMSDATSGTWRTEGYKQCVYRGSANTIIFCYMDPNKTANNWDNRWLQTYDLTVPSKPGEYGYVVTCRQVIGTSRNASISDFGTNKLLGYWKHNNVQINVAYTSNSGFSESYTGYYSESDSNAPKICASLTDTSRYYTNAYWYNDQKTLSLDGKTYQDIDTNGDYIPQYKYEKKVTLTAATIGTCDFTGWYEDQAGTSTLVSTSQTVEITAPDNGIYEGSNITNTKTYYARYTLKPEATVNIYVTPRSYWSGYDLHIWDSNGVIKDHVTPDYDSATGYYKTTVTTRGTWVKAILSKDSNYTDKTGDLTIVSSVTLGNTYNKRIDRNSSVGDRGNYRCIWFIDGTSSKEIKTWCDKSYNDGQTFIKAYISSDVNMTRIKDDCWIAEYSSLTNGSTIYFNQNYSNNSGYQRNYWQTTIRSDKSQYTASSCKTSNTQASSGSWTN